MIQGQDIVCISTSDWYKPWGSKQQLMSRLSAGNRILYVQYQASFLHLFLGLVKNRGINKILRKIKDNLFVFTPPLSLPFGYYFRFINKINQKILFLLLRQIMEKVGFENPILWIYPPSAVDLLNVMKAKLIIYHCIADFPNEKKGGLRIKTILSMEKELAENADLILASTGFLYERFKEMNDNTHLFQSAVDDKLFSLLLNSKTHQPSDIASIRRPRIGVIGYLDGKVLDIALLCHIADTSPTWSLVLIGPKFRHLNELEILHGRENVYFLGEKQHEEIPAYIGNLDVCMVPYRINKFTNNVSPLKLYEYMAAGKPVVSTNISDLTGFKDIIRISDSKEDFVREIALSLIEDSDELRDKRRKMAKENNWEKRLQFISGLIETMDSNRKG